MKVYEFTLPGFTGTSDKTDDNVKWAVAESEEIVDTILKRKCRLVTEIVELNIPIGSPGVDYILPLDSTKMIHDVNEHKEKLYGKH